MPEREEGVRAHLGMRRGYGNINGSRLSEEVREVTGIAYALNGKVTSMQCSIPTPANGGFHFDISFILCLE